MLSVTSKTRMTSLFSLTHSDFLPNYQLFHMIFEESGKNMNQASPMLLRASNLEVDFKVQTLIFMDPEAREEKHVERTERYHSSYGY